MKRTAFEQDSNSPLAELFLKTRDYVKICIGNSVKEVKREYITSYKIPLGMYCYLKVKDNYLHIGWGRGTSIDDKYKVLFGKGSIVLGQKVVKLDKTTRKIIKDYIDQTTIILIEHNEIKKMRKKNYE